MRNINGNMGTCTIRQRVYIFIYTGLVGISLFSIFIGYSRLSLNDVFIFKRNLTQKQIISKVAYKTKLVEDNFTEDNLSNCTPVKKIVFMKTHKTGGTSIAAFLDRFAYKQNLSQPIYEGIHSLTPFHRGMVANQFNLDMLTSHTLYNKREMDAVFPGAVYITIIREPVSHFESFFTYFDLGKSVHKKDPRKALEMYVNSPHKYASNNIERVQNEQLREFGFHNFDDDLSLQRKLKKLDSEFDLIMVTEYFDESLVLLKDLLCLEFTDILYLSINVRSERSELSNNIKRKIRILSKADVKFYNYFNRTFWRKVHAKGKQFEDDLTKFKHLKEKWTIRCTNNESTLKSHKAVSVHMNKLRDGLSGYDKEFCGNLLRNHIQWSQVIKERMLQQGLVSHEVVNAIVEKRRRQQNHRRAKKA